MSNKEEVPRWKLSRSEGEEVRRKTSIFILKRRENFTSEDQKLAVVEGRSPLVLNKP